MKKRLGNGWKTYDDVLGKGYKLPMELPRWLSGEESTCRCRRYGFDPWVGKKPWRMKWQPTAVFLPGKSQ